MKSIQSRRPRTLVRFLGPISHKKGIFGARSFGVLFGLLLLCDAQFANAATFVVNSTADTVDANLSNVTCADSSGACTLRAAIMQANALAGPDIIILPIGTYTLNIAGIQQGAAAGDLNITGDLTINGAGARFTTIDGHGAVLLDGVLAISAGATVTISGVTVTGGNKTSGVGGGIFNEGTLTLNSVAVSGNRAAGGGGIRTHGTLTLNSSTVSGNTTQGSGGGIWVAYGAHATLSNSTITLNSSTGGGGIIVEHQNTLATINYCTISGNTALPGSTGGGGILVTGGAAVTLQNTIVAHSVGGNCLLTNGGTITSFDHNLSDDASCMLTQPGDLSFTNPMLGALANNGGPTVTLALLPGSPALDKIPSCNVNFDQRGVARPQWTGCDIGAFELVRTTPPILTKEFCPPNVNIGQPVYITFTMINAAGQPAQTGLNFTDALPNPPITSATLQSNTCGGTPTLSGNVVGLQNGALPPGPSSCSVMFQAIPTKCGVFHNTSKNIHQAGSLDYSNLSTDLTVNCPNCVEVYVEKIALDVPAGFAGSFHFNTSCTPPGGAPVTGVATVTIASTDPLKPFKNSKAKIKTVSIGCQPPGTTCTITETGPMPHPPRHCNWKAPTYGPPSGSITVTSSGPNIVHVFDSLSCSGDWHARAPSDKNTSTANSTKPK